MKRIFHPFDVWEDQAAGMWRHVSGDERALLADKAARFMEDTEGFGMAMLRVVAEWPIACQVNLSTRTFNRQAWIGHAATVLITGAPEDVTRQAWHTLSKEKQDAANAVADLAIKAWETAQTKRSGDAKGATSEGEGSPEEGKDLFQVRLPEDDQENREILQRAFAVR